MLYIFLVISVLCPHIEEVLQLRLGRFEDLYPSFEFQGMVSAADNIPHMHI